MTKPKIAIVCDWLTNMGGAERTVLALHKAFPDAPIYTSVYTPASMPLFAGLDIRTTWLQRLPAFLRKRHQLFPILRNQAFRKLDMREYDIIISAASAEAKAVIKRPDAVHICYCHTPTRYYWSHYREYVESPGFGPLNPVMRIALPALVHAMRKLDLTAAKGVDYFIANSTAVADRIRNYYNQDSTIIYPPVDINRFRKLNITGKRQGLMALGRLVPYKRFDIAMQACAQLGVPLTVYGSGPDAKRLQAFTTKHVRIVSGASDHRIATALTKAKGYIFPQEEDFGITHIEALAAGTPVIAYAKGGALDTITDGKTGVFFKDQSAQSLANAITRFNDMHFVPKLLHTHAKQFSEERFIIQIRKFVAAKMPKQFNQ